ncbi:MAG: hypothetical protein IJ814_07795 [Paludibacteraceae bacterium]|nr:hypothetical protein [Paludibacteraceae bacterium]
MRKLLIILLSALSLTAFAQQKKVAVYVTGQQTGINKVLGDQLVAAFAKSGKYIAIERTASFLAELGKEQNYQRTGAVDDSELSRLGKQFGVQLVCVADVSDVFGEKYISSRLIDVESAEVVNTSNATSKLENMQELLNVTDGLAKELTAKTVQEKAAEAAAEQKAKETEIQRLKKAISEGYIQIDNIMVVVANSYPEMTHASAKNEANRFNLGGFNDWRLPSPSEMSRIKNVFDQYHATYWDFPSLPWDTFGCSGNYSYYRDGTTARDWNAWKEKVVFVRDVK